MHTCTHIHMHMHTQAHRQEVWQGGASINRTAGLLGKGRGGGSPSQSGIKRGGLTNPLATGLHTHMAHMHIHANAHIHTTHEFTHTIHTYNSHIQCTHINTHAHVCMCIIHVCIRMHTCTHTFTHTQKYCWTANTL